MVSYEGVEFKILIYGYSDSTDIEIVATLISPVFLDISEGFDPLNALKEYAKGFPNPYGGIIDDWRLMTREEIADYKEREDQENNVQEW